jgi:hypothetical protein
MADFIETVGIAPLLEAAEIEWRGRNFEDLYSDIVATVANSVIRIELEQAIEQYFSSLSLPASPTIYDYLVLGLRRKDVIATFNWDPFLIQAYRRSACVTRSLPYLLFLHGCVGHGFCPNDQTSGIRGAVCLSCGEAFVRDRLLFPVDQKDYSSTPEIKFAWEAVRKVLKDSLMLTIFGYGAPKSDRDAVALLKDAWGDKKDRQFEQIDIVDVRSKDELADLWSDFIHTHHYDVYSDFHKSFLAMHPRRSIEAFHNQYIDAKFIDDNPAPVGVDLAALHSWYGHLIDAERTADV